MTRITTILLNAVVLPALAAAASAPLAPSPASRKVWTPVPAIVATKEDVPPSDAIVLFDGRDVKAWESAKAPGEPAPWILADGVLTCNPKTGDIQTKSSFGDIQLHLEFRTPAEVRGEGQFRGNGGVFFMGLYEVQILDSYDNPTYVNGQAGAVYLQHAPLVNAARGPGQWQSYDVIWLAPRFSERGELLRPASVTLFHNSVLVQHNVRVLGPTARPGPPHYTSHPAKLPLRLQDHRSPISYRNIWVREIQVPDE
jgi:hypothetical protein